VMACDRVLPVREPRMASELREVRLNYRFQQQSSLKCLAQSSSSRIARDDSDFNSPVSVHLFSRGADSDRRLQWGRNRQRITYDAVTARKKLLGQWA
jgi:hypothetical protein